MDNKTIVIISVVAFIALALVGNYNIQQMHSGGFYRTQEIYEDLGPVVYYEEGLYATVTVRDLFGQGKSLFLNGKGQGSSGINDLRVNFLLAYLPLLTKPEIENVLVIGLGTGTTSGQLAKFSKVKTLEIESEVIGATSYFTSFNLNVIENPNHELIINDARNHLLKNEKEYDLIVQEPSDPWQSFSTNLYSKEFFELLKEDLSENGLYIKWVPIYTMSPEDFKSLYATFDSIFPNNVAFANIKPTENTPVILETSEIILVGSKKNIEISKEVFDQNYQRLPSLSKQGLENLRLSSGEEIYNLLIFTSEQMEGYAQDSDLVTDNNPILEFSTAKNVLNQNPGAVIEDIENYLEEKNG
ncbi:MAG: hypothetical protein WDZ77_01410 [Candidatus Pacearchaeota archaeon]